jgi:hypothetical protein
MSIHCNTTFSVAEPFFRFRRPEPGSGDALTTPRIYEMLADLSETDSYFHRRDNHGRMQRLARQAADRLGRDFEADWGLGREAIADALYFHVWTQLCTIIPLRRLARRFPVGQTVRIAAPSTKIRLFEYWLDNQAAPLILAYELQRRGTPVILVGKVEGDALRLTCRPPSLWSVDCAGPRDVVVAPEAMRSTPQDLLRRAEAALYDQAFWRSDFGHAEVEPVATPIVIPLREQDDGGWTAETPPQLGRLCLSQLLGPPLAAVAAKARQIFAARGVREIHTSDVLTPVSCLLAAEVRARGGSVRLWPHSANPVGVAARRPGSAQGVTVVLRAATEIWRERLPNVPVHLRPDLMLPRPAAIGGETDRLTIVLFGGARRHAYFPVLRIRRHEATLRALVKGLLALDLRPRLIFKPKIPWSTPEWFEGVVGDGVEVVNEPVKALAAANTLFVSVDHGSSALIEGLRLGVPAMIVRGQDLEDYTLLPRSPVPYLEVAEACAAVAALRDAAQVAELGASQGVWLEEETRQ